MKAIRSNYKRMSTLAARYHEHGFAGNVVKLENEEEKILGSNDIKVKMLAAPINPSDLNIIDGNYGFKVDSFPAVGGNEGVGIVTEVGNQVKNVQVDDHVVPATPGFGTWRQSVVTDAEKVLKMDKSIPIEIAATLTVNPCTAYRLLADFESLKAGDVVVQNGANSAVGQAVVQLAKVRGIKTVNIVRDGVEYDVINDHLKGLGADVVCTSEYSGSHEFTELLSDLPAPKLGLNGVGGKDANNVLRVLGKDSTMVTYGAMSRNPWSVPASALIFKNIQLKGFWMSEWVKTHSVQERLAMMDEIVQLAKDGKFGSWVEKFQFTDFEDAMASLSCRRSRRKILLSMQ